MFKHIPQMQRTSSDKYARKKSMKIIPALKNVYSI